MHRLQVLSNHLLSKPFQRISSAASPSPSPSSSYVEERLPIKIHPLVKAALDKHGHRNNVVALESTIITHGMPFPQNVETARQVEAQIRKYGSIPATIAILDGIIHVGLTDDQLDRLGKLGPQNVRKCSRRDLSLICARGEHGATTVSATMIIAHMVGIRVFVTGGIGGVHRGVNETMDISSDLTELGRTPVCVVSAGVKSILDIPRTLEFLETEGVTVGSYQTDEFPAFFTSKSGYKAHCRFDSPEEVARVIDANGKLHLNSGILVSVPIPEHEEGKASKINAAIDQAVQESVERGVGGKDVTPFLLQRINELTGGESLRANIALILNNAKIGSQIASALPLISSSSPVLFKPNNLIDITTTTTTATPTRSTSIEPVVVPKIICIGGCVLDISASPKPGTKLLSSTSNPGQVKLSFGGVARNCVELLKKQLQMSHVGFVTALGNDSFGQLLKRHLLDDMRLDDSGIFHSEQTTADNQRHKQQSARRTAVYNCMIDETGEMVTAVADMDILEKELTPERVQHYLSTIAALKKRNNDKNHQASILFVDGNVSIETLKSICHFASSNATQFAVFFEPTSVVKSTKPVHANCLSQISYMKPNEEELYAMTSAVLKKDAAALTIYECMKILVGLCGVQNIFLTRGKYGVIHSYRHRNKIVFNHYHAIPATSEQRVNVTGCGDNFAAALIYGIAHGYTIEQAIWMGLRAAFLTLQCEESVNPKLSVSYITTKQREEHDMSHPATPSFTEEL